MSSTISNGTTTTMRCLCMMILIVLLITNNNNVVVEAATRFPTARPTKIPTTAPTTSPTWNDSSSEFLAAELKSSAYICLNADPTQELCFGISPGGNDPVYDPDNLFRLQLKRRSNNEATGQDYRKTRWTINRLAGQMRLTNFTSLCIGRDYETPTTIVLQQCDNSSNTSVAQWDLSAFLGKDPLERGLIRTKKPSNMCLTVMTCDRTAGVGDADALNYCKFKNDNPALKLSDIMQGSFIKLKECHPDLALAQTFRQTVDCATNCLPMMLKNQKCDLACANDACQWDNGLCATPSPTPPTLSPTFTPSATPTTSSPTTSSPSASPSTLSPTATPSERPSTSSPTSQSPTTSSPTTQPSSSPIVAVPTASPTVKPSASPSASPSSTPTNKPSKSPTRAPVNVTLTAALISEPDLTPLWIVLGLFGLFILCLCPIALRVYPVKKEVDDNKDKRVSVELLPEDVVDENGNRPSPYKNTKNLEEEILLAAAAASNRLPVNRDKENDASPRVVVEPPGRFNQHEFDADGTDDELEAQRSPPPVRPPRVSSASTNASPPRATALSSSGSSPERRALDFSNASTSSPPVRRPPPPISEEQGDDSPEARRARQRAAAEMGINPTASGRYLPFGAKPAQNWDGGHAPGAKDVSADQQNLMRTNSRKFADEVLPKHMSGRFQPLPKTMEEPPVTPPRATHATHPPTSASSTLGGSSQAGFASPASSVSASSPQRDYNSMSVKQLKMLISARGGDPSGFIEKSDLVAAARQLY